QGKDDERQLAVDLPKQRRRRVVEEAQRGQAQGAQGEVDEAFRAQQEHPGVHAHEEARPEGQDHEDEERAAHGGWRAPREPIGDGIADDEADDRGGRGQDHAASEHADVERLQRAQVVLEAPARNHPAVGGAAAERRGQHQDLRAADEHDEEDDGGREEQDGLASTRTHDAVGGRPGSSLKSDAASNVTVTASPVLCPFDVPGSDTVRTSAPARTRHSLRSPRKSRSSSTPATRFSPGPSRRKRSGRTPTHTRSPVTNPEALDRRTNPFSVRTTAAAPSADWTSTGRMLRTARNSATKRVRGAS